MDKSLDFEEAIENVKSPNDLKNETEEEEIYSDKNQETPSKKQTQKAQDDYQKDLDNKVTEAKKSVVEFLEGLLKSNTVKWWLKIFMFFMLFCLIWVVAVTIYDMMYNSPPNPFFIKLWSNSMDYLKTFFAAVGFVVIVFKIFLNGKL